ncbi:ABC transporter substrate-binding protein [soil metagenome]
MTQILLLAVLLLLAACTGGALDDQREWEASSLVGRKTDTVTVWLGAGSATPTPSLHPHRTSPHLTAALFSPLVVTDPVSRLPSWGPDVPGAVLQSISSSDLRRWELTIKPGWRWHDGSRLVAGDLERGWRTAMAAGLPLASTLTDVRATDDRTLAVALAAPFGQFPHLLVHPTFLPLPPVAGSSPSQFDAAPVGNGPYRLAGRDGSTFELEAVDDHPLAGPAALDRLLVQLTDRPGADADVAVGADGQTGPPEGEGAVLRSEALRLPGRQLAYLAFPLTEPAFTNPDVRWALALALDTEALVADVLDGAVTPADRLVGPGFARTAAVVCEACRYDPDAARQRWPDDPPQPLTIWFAADGDHREVVDFIAAAWSDVLGVEDVQLASLPGAELLQQLGDATVDGPFRLSWQADVSSPSRLLEPLFGPRGGANDARYRSEPVEELLRGAGLERNLPAGLEAYGAIETAVLEDLPVIPLWFSTVSISARPDISGILLDGEGLLDWSALRG